MKSKIAFALCLVGFIGVAVMAHPNYSGPTSKIFGYMAFSGVLLELVWTPKEIIKNYKDTRNREE